MMLSGWKSFVFAASMAVAAPALAAPGDVNADTFYTDAKALMAKGMGAMFDKRTKPMIANMKAAGEAARSANEAASAQGKPLYCVPEAARKKGMGADEAVAMLGRMPPAERRSKTLSQAWRTMLIRTYPCR